MSRPLEDEHANLNCFLGIYGIEYVDCGTIILLFSGEKFRNDPARNVRFCGDKHDYKRRISLGMGSNVCLVSDL